MLESLESRILLSAIAGMTPYQVRHAYGFDQVMLAYPNGAKVYGTGYKTTIAIVDAYDDPNIVQDFLAFNRAFGWPSYDRDGSLLLSKAYPGGKPAADAGWAQEISLDVEWAHAVAPYAHILLVEAKSSSLSDMLAAVDYARKQPGVVAVSMSWGSSEFSTEASLNGYFLTPPGHLGASNQPGGVTFVASSGDGGAPPNWPAISTNVLSVGGTSLSTTANGAYVSETAWSGSGGGFSQYVPKPAFQAKLVPGGMRGNPDVAYNADPVTGVAVYDSLPYFGASGWIQVGGTSAGAPQWAGLMAIVAQGREIAGKNSLDGPTQTLPLIYSLPASDFHDITAGSNGLSAAVGYDPVTGRGSPKAAQVIADLIAWSPTPAAKPKPAAAPAVSLAALPHIFSAGPVIRSTLATSPLLTSKRDTLFS